MNVPAEAPSVPVVSRTEGEAIVAAAHTQTSSTAAHRRSCPTEHVEAVAFVAWAQAVDKRYPDTGLQWLHHVPNGGAWSKAAGGKLKAEGVVRGVPDYLLWCASGDYAGLAIELKRQRGAGATPEQRAWLARMAACGWRAEVCRGWQAAAHVVTDYLALPDEALTRFGVR